MNLGEDNYNGDERDGVLKTPWAVHIQLQIKYLAFVDPIDVEDDGGSLEKISGGGGISEETIRMVLSVIWPVLNTM